MTYTQIQWGIVLFFVLVVSTWIHFSSVLIYYNKESLHFSAFLSSFFFLLYIFYVKFRSVPEITILLQSLFVLQFYVPLMVTFSYLACTANQPFFDSTLVYIDSSLNVNSASIVLWLRQYDIWHDIFSFIYQSYYFEWITLVLYFTYRGKWLHLQRFLTQFMIAAPLAIFISIFTPAQGSFVWYHYTPSLYCASALQHVLELRHQILDISTVDGVVTFPSFHTIMALIYAYNFRFERKIIFIPVLILNLLIIFSCLPIGQHYLADILGALPVFMVVIWLEKLIFKSVPISQVKNHQNIKKTSPESSFLISYRKWIQGLLS